MTKASKERWLFACDTRDPLADLALGTQVNALLMIKVVWTEKQREIFRIYSKEGNRKLWPGN